MTTSNIKKIDIETLKMIPATSEKAKAILELFSNARRSRRYTTYQRLKRVLDQKHLEFSRDDFKAFCDDVEHAGVGRSTVIGRSRKLEWLFNSHSVACAALGLKNGGVIKPQIKQRPAKLPNAVFTNVMPLKKEIPKPVEATPVKPSPTKPTTSTAEVITIRRSGFEVDIALDELTADKCRRVAELLVSLSARG